MVLASQGTSDVMVGSNVLLQVEDLRTQFFTHDGVELPLPAPSRGT